MMYFVGSKENERHQGPANKLLILLHFNYTANEIFTSAMDVMVSLRLFCLSVNQNYVKKTSRLIIVLQQRPKRALVFE